MTGSRYSEENMLYFCIKMSKNDKIFDVMLSQMFPTC